MKIHPLLSALLLALAIPAAIAAGAPASHTNNLVAPPLLLVKGAQTPIRTQSLAVTTEIMGGLARTTVDIAFHNPNARQLEGELEFPLQPGQRISGFALDINGHMRAAVPVEKAKGQDVFEAVERHRIDPGLLEQTAGNQFRLRIYPIPANGDRRVRIVIDQSLERAGDGWRLQLPLMFARGVASFPLHLIAHGQANAPRVVDGFGDVDFQRDGDGYSARIDAKSSAIRSGLSVRFDAKDQPQAFMQALDGQHYVHVELPLSGKAVPRAMPKTIGLLWDSSASARQRDIGSELAVLDRYFKAVGNATVRLTRLRDVAESERTFSIRNGDWSALRKELQGTVYDGASALADWKPQNDVQEYLLVSDGLSNYGTARELPMLSAQQRLYTLDSAGANADATRLAAWADTRGGRLIAWQGQGGIADASSELILDAPHLLSIHGVGVDGLVAASRYPQSGYLRIAGRLNQPTATIILRMLDAGRERSISIPVDAHVPVSNLVGALWAGYSIDALAGDPELHRGQMRRLATQFGLVSAETSLIVLENAADYARYDITPPPELRDEVARMESIDRLDKAQAKQVQLEKMESQLAEKIDWWHKSWPKDRPADHQNLKASRSRDVQQEDAAMASPRSAPMPTPMTMAPPPPPAPAMRMMVPATSAVSRNAGGGRSDKVSANEGTHIGIAMQPWKPDSPFARRLRAAKANQVYAVYLDERDDHADSSAFYLDVADILFERGQRALALRVLSNLAELHLENRQLLRVLGYRLMQAHAAQLAVPVFEHVSRLAANEPQSWRDLGLAYAAAGRDQDAIDSLYKVVTGTWDSRFPSVELIALGELDAIIALSHNPLDTRAIDRRLLRNLPLDLRVVLSWDSDNTDIDLWVTDPNGEKTYYGSPHSYQGGWLSHDCTGGYGPEEFILRNAKPGKYKIEANFFGDHSQLVTGATTLQLHLFTGFGTARQKDQAVTLRLKDAKDTVVVGTFDVK
jgi:tetratricopeptide (TPR) repeat protein